MRTLFLFTYRFPPDASVGAIRPAMLFKYLPEFGWNPVVITRHWRREDSTLLDLKFLGDIKKGHAKRSGKQNDILRAKPPYRPSLWFRLKRRLVKIENPSLKPFVAIPRALFAAASVWTLNEQRGWAKKAVQTALQFAKGNPPDLCMGTYMQDANLWAGSEVAAKLRTPFIADFRDGWDWFNPDANKGLILLLRLKLNKYLRNAVLATGVSKPICDYVGDTFHIPTYVLPNGFDDEEYKKAKAIIPNYFQLLYTGTVWASPGWQILFDGIRRFSATKDEASLRMKFVCYGYKTDLLKVLAKKYSIENLIDFRMPIEREKCLGHLKGGHVLILVNPEDFRGFYSKKFFDYLGSGNPILQVCKQRDVASSVIDESRSGIVAQTPQEVAKALEAWFEEWQQKGKISIDINHDVVSNFNYRNLVSKLAQKLEEVV